MAKLVGRPSRKHARFPSEAALQTSNSRPWMVHWVFSAEGLGSSIFFESGPCGVSYSLFRSNTREVNIERRTPVSPPHFGSANSMCHTKSLVSGWLVFVALHIPLEPLHYSLAKAFLSILCMAVCLLVK
mmetsp:Transcript_70997/g.148520  ORF Transcript_70997/g.148520 Transcript_70997/m.148520 type:complete len:129 (-) Transcript_70997:76-462(-)